MKYATVKFLNSMDDGYSQAYTFTNEVGAAPYDTVIVRTRYGISIAIVDSVSDELPLTLSTTNGMKEVMEIIQCETTAKITRYNKSKALKEQMKQRAKSLDERQIYEVYAKSDPEMAELLAQLKELDDE